MKATMIEKTNWNMYDMRGFCIRHNFYTLGDCAAYDAMLKKVEDTEPTTENIIEVANDIYYHSEQTEALDITNIMTMIANEVVDRWFESHVEEEAPVQEEPQEAAEEAPKDYTRFNAWNVLQKVDACINELEAANERASNPNPDRMVYKGWSDKKVFKICSVCEELSIFDWWNETHSLSQLRQMRSFLKLAIQCGFNGYVCFKVGAKGCSNGMWAHREESTTGHSPDGDTLYHSFVSGENYYDAKLNDEWIHEELTLKQVKEMFVA